MALVCDLFDCLITGNGWMITYETIYSWGFFELFLVNEIPKPGDGYYAVMPVFYPISFCNSVNNISKYSIAASERK